MDPDAAVLVPPLFGRISPTDALLRPKPPLEFECDPMVARRRIECLVRPRYRRAGPVCFHLGPDGVIDDYARHDYPLTQTTKPTRVSPSYRASAPWTVPPSNMSATLGGPGQAAAAMSAWEMRMRRSPCFTSPINSVGW
ncbi:hypothetical protein APCd_gp39 [Azospirillum phage Cd]|uniref:hypothetical protein n=1 Tax=Azospirillum phage Cd TaxID=467481 RepID=UPI000165BD54|nr:hypothetical protein APCd_gp39 [Azospirillum phage Cd]CAO99365.1 hypothetical protein [Azospirillum phage Cd]